MLGKKCEKTKSPCSHSSIILEVTHTSKMGIPVIRKNTRMGQARGLKGIGKKCEGKVSEKKRGKETGKKGREGDRKKMGGKGIGNKWEGKV